MNARAGQPKAALVFDVNVLIDAADSGSPMHDAAIRALSDDNGMPVYFSETMLRTTANKLLEMGANPTVVQEYVEFITSEDDYGPDRHTLGYVPVTDYGLMDKYGNPDYEDSTIVSLMDAAEQQAHVPAILVTNDNAFHDWCGTNRRMAVKPQHLSRLSDQRADELQQASFQYLSRRMFTTDDNVLPRDATKVEARRIVDAVRTEHTKREQAAPSMPRIRPRRPPVLLDDDSDEESNEHVLQL